MMDSSSLQNVMIWMFQLILQNLEKKIQMTFRHLPEKSKSCAKEKAVTLMYTN